MATIEELQAQIAEAQRRIDWSLRRVRSLGAYAPAVLQRLQAASATELSATTQLISDTARRTGDAARADWRDAWFWDGWNPGDQCSGSAIRYGTQLDSRDNSELGLPASVPLVGGGKAIVLISETPQQAAAAAGLMQSMVVRAAAIFPQQSRFTLLDPAGNGMAFPMARHLPRVSPTQGDVRRDLDTVIAEIQRIIGTYLDAATTSFEFIPDEMRINEAFHLVFAADYPNRYDLRAAEALQSIADTGPRAGVYLVAHHHLAHATAVDAAQYSLGSANIIDLRATETTVGGLPTRVAHDSAPPADLQETVFERIRNAPSLVRPVLWQDVAGLDEAAWWAESATSRIFAPMGRHGANKPLAVWFGEDDGRPCVHGLLGAMSGAGKSNLLHSIICSLAVRYSPDELSLYLIDGKYGVEFQPYKDLPHAAVVSLLTSAELARSVLAELVDEMGRRNAIFQQNGLDDLIGYRAAGQPDGVMPRVLLVVDEYQQLFDDDKDGEASAHLLRLSEQGRGAGIHMLLASQSFDTTGMLHRANIFGNVHLRMAMMLSQADIAALTDFSPTGRRLIAATCTEAGKVVINDRGGQDLGPNSTIAGKVALLDDRLRDELVQRIAAHAEATGCGTRRRVVFNGHAQPELHDNPYVTGLVARDAWADPDEMEAIARAPISSGGFAIPDWLAAECPLILFTGQEFNVRGHARVVLKRSQGEHLLIVGQRPNERIGIIAGALASLAVTNPRGRIRFQIGDRCVPNTPWSTSLAGVGEDLTGAGFHCTTTGTDEGVGTLLQEAADEVARRHDMAEADQAVEPALVIVLHEADRVGPLMRVPDDYGTSESATGKVLRYVLTGGARVGVHLILACSSPGGLRMILDDKFVQQEVRHRIAMQMSEDDSFGYVRSSAASKLQLAGPTPVCALAFDSHLTESVKFKPYSLEPSTGDRLPLLEQIDRIAKHLASRP